MLFTKEKLVALLAAVLALYSLMTTFQNYKVPGAVPAPAASEDIKPYDPDEDLIPTLQSTLVWTKGRNPFLVRESYAQEAPVPLAFPPAIADKDYIPKARVGKGFLDTKVVEYDAPDIDPEPNVPEPVVGTGGEEDPGEDGDGDDDDGK